MSYEPQVLQVPAIIQARTGRACNKADIEHALFIREQWKAHCKSCFSRGSWFDSLQSQLAAL